MALVAERYSEQVKAWPAEGRHILSQYDDDTIVVYQAYRSSTGRYAAEHGVFGPGFSRSRMSWIKPGFLWMMYRSGWGTRAGQEVVLALRLPRSFFDWLLFRAVPSSWDRDRFARFEDWSRAVRRSAVLVQWDPDHDPSGGRLDRRVIQLGLRGDALAAFGQAELVEVIDVSDFVGEQRERLASGGVSSLMTPRERVYLPRNPVMAAGLGLAEDRRTVPDAAADDGSVTIIPSSRTSAGPAAARIGGSSAPRTRDVIPTYEQVLDRAEQLAEAPVAIEAFWDGDSVGWHLVLTAIVLADAIEHCERSRSPSGYRDHVLALLRGDGGDLRLFNGKVPPWSEAVLAREIGERLAARFGVPFYFPSPEWPELKTPRWWQRHEATR